MTNPIYPDAKTSDTHAAGVWYQDYVKEALESCLEMSIHYFPPGRNQIHVGESEEGVEVKFDRISSGTRRFWIETAERSRANATWVASGIKRNDNTIWYCIGNLGAIFVFRKSKLVELYESGWFKLEKTKTSIGFFLSERDAERLAEGIVVRDGDDWKVTRSAYARELESLTNSLVTLGHSRDDAYVTALARVHNQRTNIRDHSRARARLHA